jgi:hypothetical protein
MLCNKKEKLLADDFTSLSGNPFYHAIQSSPERIEAALLRLAD